VTPEVNTVGIVVMVIQGLFTLIFMMVRFMFQLILLTVRGVAALLSRR
jgi:hypothetical protein